MAAKTATARSAAAYKAHATRREKALKEKRHNAAVKAHATRREKALKEKRHNAAVKAWATRNGTAKPVAGSHAAAL